MLLRLVQLVGSVIAVAFGYWLFQGWAWQHVVIVLIGWTMTGLIGCLFWMVLKLEGKLAAIGAQTRGACLLVGKKQDEHEERLNRQLKLLTGLTRAGEISAARMDRVVDAHAQLRGTVTKLGNIAEMHQTTLDVVGLALGVKNPRPGDESFKC
jgi:hypothetical protein